MRLDGHRYSPALLQRILTLAGRLKSFEQVAIAMQVAAEVDITGRHVQRLTQEVGAGLAQQRDAQAAQYRRRELPARAPPPPVAVVEVDGGRLGTRQSDAGPGVHQPQAKEDKVGCLISMRSDCHDADPQPEPPSSLRDARRVARLVQHMQGKSTPADDAATPAEVPAVVVPPTATARPQRLLRTCVASMVDSHAFGLLMATEAQSRGFYEAPRQAFLGDGQQYNWWIQRTYFPHFEAIADFLHVLCYLYLAAGAAGAAAAAPWQLFERWMTACWQGRVSDVLAELAVAQERLGRPPPEAAADDPRQLVAEALRYVQNNQARMDYPRYRRLGLPVTSSLVESLVGEFNARVKGPEKWWNRTAGAEAILQVRAAVLSEDDRLARYLAERPGQVHRRHHPAKRGAASRPRQLQSQS